WTAGGVVPCGTGHLSELLRSVPLCRGHVSDHYGARAPRSNRSGVAYVTRLAGPSPAPTSARDGLFPPRPRATPRGRGPTRPVRRASPAPVVQVGSRPRGPTGPLRCAGPPQHSPRHPCEPVLGGSRVLRAGGP